MSVSFLVQLDRDYVKSAKKGIKQNSQATDSQALGTTRKIRA